MKRKRERYWWARACIGWTGPQIQFQITPLSWGIGGGIGTHKISLLVGPVAVAIWYRLSHFQVVYHAQRLR